LINGSYFALLPITWHCIDAIFSVKTQWARERGHTHPWFDYENLLVDIGLLSEIQGGPPHRKCGEFIIMYRLQQEPSSAFHPSTCRRNRTTDPLPFGGTIVLYLNPIHCSIVSRLDPLVPCGLLYITFSTFQSVVLRTSHSVSVRFDVQTPELRGEK
jgi:hypothetical protein